MLYRRVCYLIFAVLLVGATACQPVPLPAITPEESAPAIALPPAVTATAQPTATVAPAPTAAPTATAPVQPTAAAPLEPTPTQTPHGTPLLPESCRPASGNRVYIRAEDAFCFSFPERFKIEVSAPGAARIVGPALEKNADPIRVTLEVTTKTVPAGNTLDGSVDEALAEFADFKAWEIKRTPTQVEGEPAVVVEPVPGRLSGRALYFMHGNTFYKLYFWPVGVKPAQADLAELYGTVIGSFHFLPAPATPAVEEVKVIAGPLSVVLPAGLATGASGSQVPCGGGVLRGRARYWRHQQ